MQQPIHDALYSDDPSHDYLIVEPDKSNLYYGVASLASQLLPTINTAAYGEVIRSELRALALALGIRRVTNPETPGTAHPEAWDPDSILNDVEAETGTPLTLPNPFNNELVIPSKRGGITIRMMLALYQAIRLQQVAGPGSHVLEIGAGMGRGMYFAHKMGMRCTSIDLPMTLVGQAVFLAAALGEDAISLYGESAGDRTIVLLPTFALSAVTGIDAVMNADSFTEMDAEPASSYIAFAAENAKWLFSINHESNPDTVRKLAELQGLRPDYRAPCWIRPGYVEELYSF